MNAIMGTWKNGLVVLDEKVEWPDGSRVLVEPAPREESMGIRDKDWPTTPEEIGNMLAAMDQLETVDMTPEEEAEWQKARKAVKDYTLANQPMRIEGLFE